MIVFYSHFLFFSFKSILMHQGVLNLRHQKTKSKLKWASIFSCPAIKCVPIHSRSDMSLGAKSWHPFSIRWRDSNQRPLGHIILTLTKGSILFVWMLVSRRHINLTLAKGTIMLVWMLVSRLTIRLCSLFNVRYVMSALIMTGSRSLLWAAYERTLLHPYNIW